MGRIDSNGVDLSALDLRDAVDLAIAIEGEAADRYRAFSGLVGGRYPGDADDVFDTMAELEDQHRAALADSRRRIFGDVPSRVDASAVQDVEAPDHGAIRPFMGPREALRVALDAERRAVAFYDEASRVARHPAARVFFEEQRARDEERCVALEAWMRSAPPGPDLDEEQADPPGSDGG